MASRGPLILEVSGRTFRFELHDRGGPFVLGRQGRPLVMQPGPQSLFWEAFWHWDRQGRQVDDQGRCIFEWETALVQITDQRHRARPAAPTIPPAAPERATPVRTTYTAPQFAKLTIKSVPEDAEIFVDGKFIGNAPARLTLSAGRHHFRVALQGYEEWSKALELIPDSELTLVAKLVKQAASQES